MATLPGEEIPGDAFLAIVGALLFLGVYISAAWALPIRSGDHAGDDDE